MALVILAGAFAGGFVSGLAGFGTGLVALGIWLHAVPPTVATPLVVLCSVVSQTQTIRAVWHAIDFRRAWPMLAAGVIGVPIGVRLLPLVDPTWFRFSVGLLLLGFSAWMLAGRVRLSFSWGGRPADAVVGLCGGILGGVAGLSGPLPTVWATIRGWSKDQRRGIFQVYNLTILFTALLAQLADGLFAQEPGWLILAALLGTIAGSWLGSRLYRRLSDLHFHRVVLILLSLSGITLIWAALFG